jgi:hypothetical protein
MTLVSLSRRFLSLADIFAPIRTDVRIRSARLYAMIVMLLVVGAHQCFAQKDAGAIAGTVHDGSGAVVEGVTIAAKDVDHTLWLRSLRMPAASMLWGR